MTIICDTAVCEAVFEFVIYFYLIFQGLFFDILIH